MKKFLAIIAFICFGTAAFAGITQWFPDFYVGSSHDTKPTYANDKAVFFDYENMELSVKSGNTWTWLRMDWNAVQNKPNTSTDTATITKVGVITQGTWSTSTQNGPYLSATTGADQTIDSCGVATKMTFTSVTLDSHSYFASSTFTPKVAGIYNVSASAAMTGVSVTSANIMLYKNGAEYKKATFAGYGGNYGFATISSLVSMNGITDTIEVYVLDDASNFCSILGSGAYATWNSFNANYIR